MRYLIVVLLPLLLIRCLSTSSNEKGGVENKNSEPIVNNSDASMDDLNTSIDDFPFTIDADIDSVISVKSSNISAPLSGRVVYQVFIESKGDIKGVNILSLNLYDSSNEKFVEYLKYAKGYKEIDEYPSDIQSLYSPIISYLEGRIKVYRDNNEEVYDTLYYITVMRKIEIIII